MTDGSFVHVEEVTIHFDSVDVPDHLGLGQGGNPTQVLEETAWHFLVELVQVGLDLALDLLDHFNDVFGVVDHVLLELELFLDDLLRCLLQRFEMYE